VLARSGLIVALFVSLFAKSASAQSAPGSDRVHVKYWDKWTGSEKDAMQAVVDDFNASQSRIFVDFLSVSLVPRKTLTATAGGNPPDLAGLWANEVADFADKEALTPLDDFARGTIVRRERFLPVYWEMCVYEGRLFALPTTPAVIALLWNKEHFRAAGLDPERPPRTIAELDAYAEKLTKVDGARIAQVGFLPSQPVWWPHFWPYFFHGALWDGKSQITLDTPENVRAFAWAQAYAKRFGVTALENLSSSFGDLASAQDPFMSGKLSMIIQGVWMGNYISQFAPHLDWGAAPFPSVSASDPPMGVVDTDIIVIPRGAPHPREAFEFARFLMEQRSLEKLNLGQQKNSPLKDVSDDFYRRHKNPYIRMYQALASSPGAVVATPQMSVWQEYRSEIAHAFQRMWLLEATPEQALAEAGARIQQSLERNAKRRAAPPYAALRFAPVALTALLAAAVVFLVGRARTRGAGARASPRAHVSLGKGLAFSSPWTIGLVVFLGYPIACSMVYSFCEYSVLSTPRWVGLQNFSDLLADEVFWVALKNTLFYVVFALPLGLVVSFFIALLLDSNVRGTSAYRTFVFLPSLMPIVTGAMVWLWIFNADFGVANDLLARLSGGHVGPVPWLVSRRTAMPSLVLMSLWSVGQTVVILLAAMRDVPTSIYEAADIDGASLWQKVRHITLPLTSPVIYFNAIIGIIAALQLFTQPYIMTEGGPARATLTYAMRIYENAFVFLRMGYASAMAWILFVIILGLTAVAVKVGKGRVHYTGA
jgi:multiple sugar transport system substrate-binding protein